MIDLLDTHLRDLLISFFGKGSVYYLSYATLETLYMVLVSLFVSCILGLPLGVFLTITKKNSFSPAPRLNKFVGYIVNILRSFPFIVLVVVLFPILRFVVGTTTGSTAAIIPLIVSATPFIARLFETSLEEVDNGLIEASLSLGAGKITIIKMMIMESLPSIINQITMTGVVLIAYSTMVGALAAGGLGDLASRVGLQNFDFVMLTYAVIVIIVLVQIFQSIGDFIANKIRKNR